MFLSQAAQAVQTVTQAAAVDTTMMPALIPAQFTGSTIVVWLIDWMKGSKRFPWLTSETANLNRIAAVIGAAITAAGIHFALEPVAANGTWTLTITDLSISSVFHFLEAFTVSIASQQTILKIYQITNTLRKIADK